MLRIFSFIAAIFLFSGAAYAENSDWKKSDYVKARIIDENGKLGVEIEPNKGWHTYYKEVGDAGYPTEFDFAGSQNFEVKEVIYPPYKVFDEYGIKTNGYEGRTFFEIKAVAKENALVKLKLTGAICHEICIPYEFFFEHKPTPTSAHQLSIGILLTALLAGLILNIMPCVLPVLSLKVLSVVKQSGKAIKHARINFLATAMGILTSFWVLAALTISLKSTGMALGWGLHFQSPIFVGVLMLITFVFALSLFGIFHLNPPSWISGTGENKNSLAGNFLSGVLATVLGTSCTAPFLVTAVSFALSGSTTDIIIIFTLMGIGMALPFLIFAARPHLAKLLPKAGSWMNKVKYFMGILLLGTSIWLGYILYAQVTMRPPAQNTAATEWQVFDESKIATLVAEGKIVLVDITAKWCVNCKANKLNVTETEEMKQFYASHNVVLLQGDMTRPAPELLAYIKKFERYGIPVNVVYGKTAPNGILLPPILTKDAVKEAITKAK